MRFSFVVILVLLTEAAHATSGRETVVQTISFKGCLNAAQALANQIGVKPAVVIDTKWVKMFRITGSDGTILVTCSGKERKMVISRTRQR